MRVIAEIVSLAAYESQVSALLDEGERIAMEFFIATTAANHPVVPGSGGFRKVRWARKGKGKSGGYRIIYYFLTPPGTVYMTSIYAKSEKASLSAADRALLEKIAAEIKKSVQGIRRRGFTQQ